MIPYSLAERSDAELQSRADALLAEMASRRSCRVFSDRPIPRRLIETLIAIGHSAPSGANRKPWRFVAVGDPALKHEVRLAAEAEERANYQHRFPVDWLEALEPIGTNAQKPFLDVAPWLVVMFRIDWEETGGQRVQNYYPMESTGIAAGMFLMACHQVGLATLTHTPNPMKFLRELLGRPANEKPFLLIPVGWPAADSVVPDLPKKPLSEALQWNANAPM
ncbi:MAG: nitroreductase family protein [Planctomycetes bacterium]|nr:nitroreductase family protein [Planctomycetota bacterium]